MFYDKANVAAGKKANAPQLNPEMDTSVSEQYLEKTSIIMEAVISITRCAMFFKFCLVSQRKCNIRN
jgi:hypothetical protein